MITAEAVGLGAKEKISANTIVIRDASGTPTVLVVELSPNIQQIFSPGINETEFRTAIKKYGVPFDVEVGRIKL